MVTGAQLRAARGLLNVSVAEVAERTGLAINTIRRAEAGNGPVSMTSANARLLSDFFDEAGVAFIETDTMGVGVRLKSPEQASPRRRRREAATRQA